MVRGTIDRIVDGKKAVILIEDQEDKEQLVVDKHQVPEEMRYGGCMMEFERTDDGDIENIEHLQERESNRRKRLRDKFDRLSNRLSDKEEE